MLEQEIFNSGTKMQLEFTAATTDIISATAHGLVVGDLLQFTTTTTLPAGLSLATNYYVIEVISANTFKVSATVDGPTVDVTDTGTGTHTYHLKGKVIFCDGFEHVILTVNTANSANLTIKFAGAYTDDAPDFNAAQSSTNRWDYLDIVDLEDKSSIDGDTGLSPAGTDDQRHFEVNTNNLRWFTAIITAWTAGSVEANAKANKPY